MKIKDMTIFVSRTFRLAQFESFKVEAGLTMSIEEGDNADEVRQKILEELRKSLSDSYRAYHPRYRNENRQLSR
jgi:hypothetical protein